MGLNFSFLCENKDSRNRKRAYEPPPPMEPLLSPEEEEFYQYIFDFIDDD